MKVFQVLFFDECESIFESRDKSNQRDVNMLLTELERHDGAGVRVVWEWWSGSTLRWLRSCWPFKLYPLNLWVSTAFYSKPYTKNIACRIMNKDVLCFLIWIIYYILLFNIIYCNFNSFIDLTWSNLIYCILRHSLVGYSKWCSFPKKKATSALRIVSFFCCPNELAGEAWSSWPPTDPLI